MVTPNFFLIYLESFSVKLTFTAEINISFQMDDDPANRIMLTLE